MFATSFPCAPAYSAQSIVGTGTIGNLRNLTLTMIGNLLILLAAAGTLALGALQLDSLRLPAQPVRVRADDDEVLSADPDSDPH